MERNGSSSSGRARTTRSLDYMRKRSLHRVWWKSARIALRRGRPGEPIDPPHDPRGLGKRV